MENPPIQTLLEELRHPDASVREEAIADLWQIWFSQKGSYGLEILGESQELLESGEIKQAEILLTDLIKDQPDFAEAWNRRAIIYYLQKEYRKSLLDCQQAIELNPIHFGAMHGIGLCHAALHEYTAAIQAFRKALELQPYSIVNQRLLLECSFRLS
jgi:tetratricopeptide (TPR) repeat protein